MADLTAPKTTLEQLLEVQQSISAVMGGQDVTINGKRLTRASLRDLEAREQTLLARYNREQGRGGPVLVTYIPARDR